MEKLSLLPLPLYPVPISPGKGNRKYSLSIDILLSSEIFQQSHHQLLLLVSYIKVLLKSI